MGEGLPNGPIKKPINAQKNENTMQNSESVQPSEDPFAEFGEQISLENDNFLE